MAAPYLSRLSTVPRSTRSPVPWPNNFMRFFVVNHKSVYGIWNDLETQNFYRFEFARFFSKHFGIDSDSFWSYFPFCISIPDLQAPTEAPGLSALALSKVSFAASTSQGKVFGRSFGEHFRWGPCLYWPSTLPSKWRSLSLLSTCKATKVTLSRMCSDWGLACSCLRGSFGLRLDIGFASKDPSESH